MANPFSGTRWLFVAAAIGCAAGVIGAAISSRREAPQAPVFDPAPNPYPDGIYANGIVESDQAHGSNVNLYPEVAGTVREVLIEPGQAVARGAALLRLDDRVARATTAQLQAQAQSAKALLEELHAQPRPENLAVAQAQLAAAVAAMRLARDSFDKLQHAYDIDAHAVSRDALDSASNAWQVADANRITAQRQLELTSAGAWQFDIRSQEAQAQAASRAWESSQALLAKYTLRAPADGVVLAINITPGTYISPQGIYDTYTQASNTPPIVFGSAASSLQVRCYIDEILIPKLNAPGPIKAQMFVRGTRASVPLEFVRVEPYVSPKVSLSDQRQERVDVRVLPVIFRFRTDTTQRVYPGQLVDVYVGR